MGTHDEGVEAAEHSRRETRGAEGQSLPRQVMKLPGQQAVNVGLVGVLGVQLAQILGRERVRELVGCSVASVGFERHRRVVWGVGLRTWRGRSWSRLRLPRWYRGAFEVDIFLKIVLKV